MAKCVHISLMKLVEPGLRPGIPNLPHTTEHICPDCDQPSTVSVLTPGGLGTMVAIQSYGEGGVITSASTWHYLNGEWQIMRAE